MTYIYCIILHINGVYILHISGGKFGHFTWWWNPSWSVFEHWIYGFSFAISNTITHALTSWRKYCYWYLNDVSCNTAQLTICGPQGAVLWVTSNLTICLHLKLNTVYRHCAAVGHFILHILKMFPNNSWCFHNVLAMMCFHLSGQHEPCCFQGNMAAITHAFGCMTLTFNSSWNRPRIHTKWVTQSRMISNCHFIDLIRLILFYEC